MLSSAHAFAFSTDAFEEIGDWTVSGVFGDLTVKNPCETYIEEVRAFIDETNSE
jgi:hypothetical protein